jgi:hypothetical protein
MYLRIRMLCQYHLRELTKVTWTLYKSGRTVVRAAGSSSAVEQSFKWDRTPAIFMAELYVVDGWYSP